MEQILVDLYAVANVLLLVWYVKKYGWRFSPGLLVLSFYVLIAIMAVPAYEALQTDSFFSAYDFTNITLMPYVYLFITTLILIYPTFKFGKYIRRVHISIPEKKLKIFIVAYSVCALISVYCFYRTISTNVTIETLAQVRNDLYEGEVITAYNNQIEHIIILFTVQFNTVATIAFFYAVATMRKRISVWWFVALCIGIIVPPFMDAMKTASRGMLIGTAFSLSLCYGYFSNLYSKQIKRVFLVVAVISITVFLAYSLIVTEMRFGSDDDSYSSIISYFGQPTIIFNSQVADISSFAYGARFFKPVAEFIGVDIQALMTPIAKGWSPCFDTIIGDFYVDFGPIGTFLAVLGISYLVTSYFSRKKTLTISHLYLMTFYCLSLQHGALVTKSGFCTNILFCIILYFLCNLMFGRPRKRHASLPRK